MLKLYIIGNGFDRFHYLPTSYSDFHKFVKLKYPDIESILERYFRLSYSEESLWKDFENDLGTFNWKLFFEDNYSLNLIDDNFRTSSVYGLEDDLEQESDILIEKIKMVFYEWLNQVDLSLVKELIYLENNSLFLSFNYTLTLEQIYNIFPENVLHIHGDINNHYEDLILGHNRKLKVRSEIDKNGNSHRTILTDSLNMSRATFHALEKPVLEVINSNNSFFERLKKIEEVIILGHSLSSVDIPYFKKIRDYIQKTGIWKVSYFIEKEKRTHVNSLRKIGIEKSSINLFQMSQMKRM